MERQEWERESEKNMTGEKKEKLPLCVLENSLQLCTLCCIFVATDGLWRWEEMGGMRGCEESPLRYPACRAHSGYNQTPVGQPCTWHLLCHFTVSFMGRYSLRLIIGVASPRPFADGFHLVPSAGISGGAQIHPQPGLHCHLVVVEGGVGMQLGSGSSSSSGSGITCCRIFCSCCWAIEDH